MTRIALLLALLTTRASAAPIVDFDGDGLADIAVPATDLAGEICEHGGCYRPDGPAHEVIALFLGKDHGKLSRLVRMASRPHEYERSTAGYIQRIGAVGDLDGDGRTDLAMQWDKGGESLMLVRGSKDGIEAKPYQTIAMPHVSELLWYNVDAAPAGDVDGDGRPDIVIGNAVMHGIGGGKLGPPQQITPSPELAYLHPVGDVDGDGKADLVAADVGDGKIWLVRGGKATPLAIDRFAAAIDLDGDGRRELIGSRQAGKKLTLTAYGWTKGTPTAIAAVEVPLATAAGALWQVVGADPDGDGQRDLVIVTSGDRTEIACNSIHCTAPSGYAVRVVHLGAHPSIDPKPLYAPPAVMYGADPAPHILAPGDRDVAIAFYSRLILGPTVIARTLTKQPRLVELALEEAVLER